MATTVAVIVTTLLRSILPSPVSVADPAATIGGGAFSVPQPPSDTTPIVPANKTVSAFMAVPPRLAGSILPTAERDGVARPGKAGALYTRPRPATRGDGCVCLALPGGLV